MATTSYKTDTDRAFKVGPLDELDNWKVHSEDCDIRGWHLYAGTGEKIGTVESLIADTEAKEVRYIEVQLDSTINKYRDLKYRQGISPSYQTHFGKDDDQYVLLPIGLINIDEDDKKTYASSNLTTGIYASSPRYRGYKNARIQPGYELAVAKYYSNLDDNYRDYYNEKDFDFDSFNNSPYVMNRKFYTSDLFSRDRYWSRYNTPRMAGAQTGRIA